MQRDMSKPLHLAMRATRVSEILGADKALLPLLSAVEAGRTPHTTLISGSPGSGKTTLARILALSFSLPNSKFGEPKAEDWRQYNSLGILEPNPAESNGIDAVRGFIRSARNYPLPPAVNRVYILSEAHLLTRDAQVAFLTDTEEPLDHVYWIFNTSEPSKLSEAFHRRCMQVSMPNLGKPVLRDLLARTAKAASMSADLNIDELADVLLEFGKDTGGVALQALERYASGLSALESVASTESSKLDVLAIAKAIGDGDWPKAQKMLATASKEDTMPLRIMVTGWLRGIVLKNTNEAKCLNAARAIHVISSQTDTWESGVFFNATIAALCGAAKHMRG